MRARSAVLFAFASATLWFTGFFPPHNNPNELSRIEAVVAFVESGTFSIDTTIPRLGDHMDKSVWQGRFYSNKAPGLIFAAVPVYRLLRIFFAEPRVGWSLVFALMRLATVSLASFVALARLASRLERGFPEGRRTAALLAFAAAFGTPILLYARSFFSHAWTASLLFLAWDLVRLSEERRRGAWLLAAAGLLAGWAAISEYPAAPVAAALALRAGAGAAGKRWKAILVFSAGAAPALLLLAVYDAVCFGSPFRLSSACEAFPAYAELARRPFFGLATPQPNAVLGTLFSSTRGVLVFSPFLLWAVAGWVRWWRSQRERADCLFTLAATLLVWLAITSYPNWEGGWSLGMRYLVPAVFFAVLPIRWALETSLSRGLFLAAVVYASALHCLASSSWPHFPASIAWPVGNVSAWLVAHGAVAPNVGLLFGLPPLASLLPPLVLAAAALGLCARELPPTRPGRVLACALGAALFAATLLAPLRLAAADAAWREGIARTLSGQGPGGKRLPPI